MGCLPLADLHHFCLTKGFPKTPSAISPIRTPSAFCINQIVPGFVVYYLNSIPSQLAWAEIKCTVHAALPMRPIIQLKPVQQSRQQVTLPRKFLLGPINWGTQ